MSSACLPSARRRIPVRVADVPLKDRRAAARVATRIESDPTERLRILMLAEHPGNLIAWIAP